MKQGSFADLVITLLGVPVLIAIMTLLLMALLGLWHH